MDYLAAIDSATAEFVEGYDELPLWSARFGCSLLDHIPLTAGVTILDVGAGTGWLSIELAQRCGADSRVVAVDPWQAAVDRLTRKIELLGLRNITPLVQDAATIDLPDASVDLIVSNLGINNFDNRQAALRTCFRVAKQGARIVLTTNLVGHMAEFYEVFRDVLQETGSAKQLAALADHVAHRATVDSVRAMLEEVGFARVTATTTTFRERFVDGSALLRHYFVRLGFLPAWKAIAPPKAIEATFQLLEERLNELAAREGELALTIPVACIAAEKLP